MIRINNFYKKLHLPHTLLQKFAFFGEFSRFVFAGVFFIVIWFIFRIGHCLLQYSSIKTLSDLMSIFINGIRLDIMTLSYIILPIFLLESILISFGFKAIQKIFNLYYAVTVYLIFFLEFLAFPYFFEYGTRPDEKIIEYLRYPKEVFSMLITGHSIPLFLSLFGAFLLMKLFIHGLKFLQNHFSSTPLKARIIAPPLLLVLLALGARSSLGHRSANISSVSFSSNSLLNEIVLNSTYSFLYSSYRTKHEGNPFLIYDDKLARENPVQEIQNLSTKDGKRPLKHFYDHQFPEKTGNELPNLILVLEESLGAEYTGYLGNTNLTPHIDKYVGRGMGLFNLYATGTRTVRGIEALISGFPPTPGRSVVKLSKARNDFFTLATALKSVGYKSIFFCGGDSNFDEMKSFFLGNDFNEVIDQHTIGQVYNAGSWGIHDKDLFQYGLDRLKNESGPYLAVFLTSSNHDPFDYPLDKDFELNPNYPKEGHENAIKYADYSLGYFLNQLDEQKWFDKNYIAVIADHNTRVYGDEYIPLFKFHIPGFILGGNIPPTQFHKRASSIDIPVTLLSLVGRNFLTPMPGYNLFNLPTDFSGRAIMQYHEHFGYWEEEELLVLKPKVGMKIIKTKGEELLKSEQPNSSSKHHQWAQVPFAAWNYYTHHLYNILDKN